MAEGVNVRFSGELKQVIQKRTDDSGLNLSDSEFIRDLVRRDYEIEEERRSLWLRHELRAGLEPLESEFKDLKQRRLIAQPPLLEND